MIKTKTDAWKNERGSTIVIMAVSMIFMIAMAAIAIDVVVLYVVRSEAQRAADAAALAGAHQFVTSGFTSGLLTQGQLCSGGGTGLAQQAAIAVASQNLVGGQPGVLLPSDVQCDFSKTVSMNGQLVPVNPQITVTVTRRNLPTFFSRIWSSSSLNTVTATATAEAFNESGSPTPTVSSCLKPFLIYNRDPISHQPFVDVNQNGIITRPGLSPSGFVGERLDLAPTLNPTSPAEGEFAQLMFTSTPNNCGCGGDQYQQNIQCCNTDALQCGISLYQASNNPPEMPETVNGTQCLIHAAAGQDTIVNLNSPPFQFQAGAGNPAHVTPGSPIATSDSLVTVPLFGTEPIAGSVQPIGFLQLFIESVDAGGAKPGTLHTRIVNVVGCALGGGGGGGGHAFIQGGGVSPVTVRLVQPGTGN